MMLFATLTCNAPLHAEAARQSSSPDRYEDTGFHSEAPVAVVAPGANLFVGKKVVCLGDSITAGLDGGTLQVASTTYPQFLQQMTGATVVNQGIGGSSIGTYFLDPMCSRYQKIPKDADYIIVFGGVNDSLHVDGATLGSYALRTPGSFIGDLNTLYYGLKVNYPKAQIIVINPYKLQIQLEVRKNNKAVVKQAKISEAIVTLSAEYGYPLINLYDDGILDSTNADVREQFVPDGCHPNVAGYEILARLVANKMMEIGSLR